MAWRERWARFIAERAGDVNLELPAGFSLPKPRPHRDSRVVALMPYYLIAAGLIAHSYFWGMGLARLVLPRFWRRWWWVFAPGLGLALQSAVVWAGAHTALAGTNQYAWWSELLPLGLWWAGRSPRGLPGRGLRWSGHLRLPVGVAGIMMVGAWFLLDPMAAAGRGVSSSSLGSCDHADYAAGARVLAEFSRSDRTGMLGLKEVTQVGSTDYFFDFWLRLNHFTPSALIAHNSSIFRLEPYRLISVTAAVLLLLNVPVVYLLARSVAGLKAGVALFVAGLYVLSPISAYAVHQGALGQLLAAQGIGLLAVATALQYREAGTARRLWPLGGLTLGAFWLLAGSYNFILLICLAQAGPWLLGQAWVGGQLRRLGRIAVVTGAALAVCLVFFWPRFSGIAERFQLFADHDYGWSVPLLSWEGWLGLISNVYLEAWAPPWRWLVMGALTAAWTVWLGWAWRLARPKAVASATLVLPVVAGWTILAWESLTRANASYDAFKVISVFYPGLLAGLCGGLGRGSRTAWTRGTMAGMGLVLACNLIRADEFRRLMAAPPLRVDKHLVGLGRIEQMPEVASVNIHISLYWARLWADAFLLRKPHYFAEPTYEGRNVTPLRGEWDLGYALLCVLPADNADRIELGQNFQLVRAGTTTAVRAEFGAGWHALERFGTDRWRWTAGRGRIILTNTAPAPVTIRLRMRAAGLHRGDQLAVTCNRQPVLQAGLDVAASWTGPVELTLPPGPSELLLAPGRHELRQIGNDARLLGIALHGLELQLPPDPE